MERTNRPFGRKDVILARLGNILIMNTLEKYGIFDSRKYRIFRQKTPFLEVKKAVFE